MGYRAALTANTLARTEFEAEATADATIVISCTDNEFLSASLTRQAVMSLRGADVRPQTDGLFAGIIHPFAAFDLLNDNTAGGVIDILKYHKEGSEELMRGVQGYRVIDVAGARFIETTTASTFASFPSGTKTGYGTYVVGQDAVFSVSLGATEIPEQRNYQLIVRNWEPSVADPARVVGASCAYNFKYAAMRVPQSAALHPRFRLIKAEALNGAVLEKSGYDNCSKSVNISETRQYRAKPARERVETGRATPINGEGTVRTMQRCIEPFRNAMAA